MKLNSRHGGNGREHRTRASNVLKAHALGKETGIHDRLGNPLHYGDTVCKGEYEGVLLYNSYSGQLAVFLSYSLWYGDDKYAEKSYGKCIFVPADDGARMELRLIEEYNGR